MAVSFRMSRVGLTVAAGLALAAGTAHAQQFRTIDGDGNNLANPAWGQVGLRLSRMAGANYFDGVGSVDPSRANVRGISNAVFASTGPKLDARGLSEFNWVWGQFISHDISHTLAGPANGTIGITIPVNDPFFGPEGLGGQELTMNRSNFEMSGGARQQVNNITPWIDANTVYGGRAIDGPMGVDRADWLRAGVGGRLRVSASAVGDMMPLTEANAPGMANMNVPTMGANTFVAGDVRANEHVGLVSMHTLFVREHNRLADAIGTANPGLNDDQVYDRARKIVGAQMAAITYNEYLPSLGIDMGSYSGYDPSVNPDVTNEFSTAAFRLGHSQINGVIQRLDTPGGSPIAAGNLDIVDAFFNPSEIYNGGLEAVFNGLRFSNQEATDATIVDGLRNQLFQGFVPGIGLVTDGSDLVSLNTMRGRDHGLGTFNETRLAFGLAAINDWADLTSDPGLQAALASVYNSIDDMDLWVGMLAQDNMTDASVSETVAVILAEQFDRLRAADRFWYENDLDGVNDDLSDIVAAFDGVNLTTAADWLAGLTLGEILTLNTDQIYTGNVFFIPAPGSLLAVLAGGLIATRRRRNN